MSLSLSIGLGLTAQQGGAGGGAENWIGEFDRDGVEATFVADFANDRYWNLAYKTFAEVLLESGTTRDSNGIHLTAGDTLKAIRFGAGIPFEGYVQAEGSIVIEFSVANKASLNGLYEFARNPVESEFRIWGGIQTGHDVRLFVRDSFVAADVNVSHDTYTNGATSRLAQGWKLNDFASVLDGGTVATDTGGTVPTSIDELHLGTVISGFDLVGTIKSFAYYGEKLSNAVLQAASV